MSLDYKYLANLKHIIFFNINIILAYKIKMLNIQLNLIVPVNKNFRHNF